MPLRREWDPRSLIYAAGVCYALSLHKYFIRDPLAPGSGIQGYIEAGLICAAFLCTLIAAHADLRRCQPSYAIPCFATFGILPLVFWVRSFNPTLSIGEALLYFVVLGVGYLTCHAQRGRRLFQSIYWCYTTSLVIGLIIGAALPNIFPLWQTNDYDGRTRLSVFHTFPGSVGETAAYLVLLEPLLFKRSHWISRLFLVVMNIFACAKLSTGVLLLLLAMEFLSKAPLARLWRVTAAACCISLAIIAAATLYSGFTHNGAQDAALAKGLGALYGHDVADEATSVDGRSVVWQASIDLIAQEPLLGYGFDGTRGALVKVASWSGQSHNNYLEFALIGGIPGLALFLMGVACVLRACLNSPPNLRRRTLPVIANMMIIAMTGITFISPSYFGLLILLLLLQESFQAHEALRSRNISHSLERLAVQN